MAIYIVRVELHGASPEDYEELHEKMEGRGFSRQIVADSGNEYQLPDAEYYRHSDEYQSVTDVAQEVYDIAETVISNPGVLATEAAQIEVMGLRKPT
ncbi:DUF2622 domain-containing protein [Serratia marcescens]|uniref:DUF2622 domain-containing protein n=1 Tax=Serratia marcescens TaxID=615 RepID=UPI0027E4E3D6|nr:DUF2622 domain-containing protein [Serratia marcescens]